MATYTWDVAKPADGDNISIGGIQIRADKVTLAAALADLTNWPNNPLGMNEGTARATYDTYANIPVAATEGKMFKASDKRGFWLDTGSAWIMAGYLSGFAIPLVDYWNDHVYLIDAAAYASLPSSATLFSDAQTINTAADAYGAAPKAKLRIVAKVAHASAEGKVRLRDNTAGAAVAGSEVTLAYTDGFIHIYESSEFALNIGAHSYQIQAYKSAGATGEDYGLCSITLLVIPE